MFCASPPGFCRGFMHKIMHWAIPDLLTLIFVVSITLTLLTLAAIDARTFYLPDWLTLPLMFVALMFHALGQDSFNHFVEGLAGLILGYSCIWLFNTIYRLLRHQDGIGMGDAKLLGALGAVLGWKSVFPVLFIASMLGLVGGYLWLRLKKLDHSHFFPFGPYLALTGIIFILNKYFGSPLSKFSLHFFV